MKDDIDDILKREFDALNERIFERAMRHHKYAAYMSDNLNKAIEKSLENEYAAYYALYKQKLDIVQEIRSATLAQKRSRTIPRKRRVWWRPWRWKNANEAADVSDELIDRSEDLYLSELVANMNAVNEQFAPAEPADEPPTDEPTGPTETPTAAPAPAETVTATPAPAETAETAANAVWEEEHETITHEDSESAPRG